MVCEGQFQTYILPALAKGNPHERADESEMNSLITLKRIHR